jgi:curved DNA-binding protein CbpA
VDPTKFIDYYELLQVSPNADVDTIQRVFRHLAKKYHPDHNQAPEEETFRRLVDAHKILTDPEARAGYDVAYQEYWNRKWRLVSESGDGTAFSNDRDTRERMLSLFYVQRRRSMASPGLGEYEIARLLRTPVELVDFHLWYLRAKGWIERLESGMLAISASGVDEVEQGQLKLGRERLLEAHQSVSSAADAAAPGDAAAGPDDFRDRARAD